MPRMDAPASPIQLVRLLLIGDGKCGKTDFAAMAGFFNFNVLYLDGDVGAQTIKDLPIEARRNIYLLKCGDKFSDSGGIEPDYAQFFKDWSTKSQIIWNDSKQRQYSVLIDGDKNEEDEFWILRPARLDYTCVLIIEWTALAQSAMQWAANQAGVDLGEVDERKEMRGVYQAAGEKLTQYLLLIRNAPCHVICISHPREYVKLTPPAGKTIGNTKEKDMQIAWTKQVPASSSNNHAMSMGKYFTDIAWVEPDAMGTRHIDFKINNNRISGGHFSDKYKIANRDKGENPASEFTFATLVAKIGGIIPTERQPVDAWLTIQQGYERPTKAAVILKKPAETRAPAGTNSPALEAKSPEVKGMMNLTGLKPRVPAK